MQQEPSSVAKAMLVPKHIKLGLHLTEQLQNLETSASVIPARLLTSGGNGSLGVLFIKNHQKRSFTLEPHTVDSTIPKVSLQPKRGLLCPAPQLTL